MKCERCNQNEATIVILEINNGKPQEIHICERCAQEESESEDFAIPISFQDFFQAILSIIGMETQYSDSKSGYETQLSDDIRCEVCGTTYSEFKNSGRLGCQHCYTTFKQQLDSALKNMQGSNKHLGKIPNRGKNQYSTKRELNLLREKLKEAVKVEDFEKAAKLRDKIRDMERSE